MHYILKTNKLNSNAILIVLLIIVISSCQKDPEFKTPQTAEQQPLTVANKWFEQFYALTKACPGFTPPVAARAFGYAGVALYESVVPGIPTHQSLGTKLNGLPKMPIPNLGQNYYWPACANAAMAHLARNLYANMPNAQLEGVNQLEKQMVETFSSFSDLETLNRSKVFGQAIGEAIFAWSIDDGGHEGYNKNFPENYTAPTGPGKWVPTAPSFQRALQPYWGFNREFVPGIINRSQTLAPLTYSTSPTSTFFSQALEVYTVTNTLNPEQEIIAHYWSDDPGIGGTPPGHSINIATQILTKENASLALAAETYCKVSIAVADAFISCWKSKYEFNLLRPITYIRDVIDPNWTPILTTPAFPEYSSGHSVQSSATAQVLSDLFGYRYSFIDRTHEMRNDIIGTPRTYASFYDYAEEAAISRLYGGIHFRDGIHFGLKQGRIIGESVSALPFKR
ncbi:MAG: phosphatase PAP2 family protein [Saprospiraceae bacterium]|nr:phosphatase PAP2 family protein [Saprospiraceae bacterium]MDP5091298.1 phosphatase PAP2 family protein [Saprospiraceae bacterium]